MESQVNVNDIISQIEKMRNYNDVEWAVALKKVKRMIDKYAKYCVNESFDNAGILTTNNASPDFLETIRKIEESLKKDSKKKI